MNKMCEIQSIHSKKICCFFLVWSLKLEVCVISPGANDNGNPIIAELKKFMLVP